MKPEALLAEMTRMVEKRSHFIADPDVRLVRIIVHVTDQGTVRTVDFGVDTKDERLR